MCIITKETYNVIRYEELISYLISPIWRGNVRCWWWSVFSVVRDISERGCCWCFLTVGPPALCPELWSGLECETLLAVTSSPLCLDNISPGEQNLNNQHQGWLAGCNALLQETRVRYFFSSFFSFFKSLSVRIQL